MLVLSRKKGEEIVLCVEGQTVRVRIVKVDGKTVRVGVEAPEAVLVHRKEVWDRLCAGGGKALPVPSCVQATTSCDAELKDSFPRARYAG